MELISRILGPVSAPYEATEGTIDEAYMRRALDLAWQGAGATEPNPMVGAVVVADGVVLGEGYHERCGSAHAEARALGAAGDTARGATMYVTLEPCAHFGRTPPCADAIVASGIRRVVVPALDPDNRVMGRGIELLRRGGVEVETGCLAHAAVLHNLGYYRERLARVPTVTLKMAVTMDGKIASAPGRRDTITGHAARQHVHRLRAAHDCVVVGATTAVVDNPLLDCRYVDAEGVNGPIPVVLDSALRTSSTNAWSERGRQYVIVCRKGTDADKIRRHENAGASVIQVDGDENGLLIDSVVGALAAKGFERILVEGGAEIFSSFIRAGAWDALYLFQSTRLFGEGGVALYTGACKRDGGARLVDIVRLGDDALHRFINETRFRDVKRRVMSQNGVE